MKAFSFVAKLIIGALGVCSFVAMAESMHDREFYSSVFMENEKPSDFKLVLEPEIKKRIVASQVRRSPKIHKLTTDQMSLVDGSWRITRVHNTAGDEFYNSYANQEDQARNIINDFKLIEDSIVKIDNDDLQVFNISLLTQRDDLVTLILFKQFGKDENGDEVYEILEARKVIEEKATIERDVEVQNIVAKKEIENAAKFHMDETMFLATALNPTKNKRVLLIDQIEGSIELKNGELFLNNIRLGDSEESFDITGTDISSHGYFEFEHGIHGKIQGVVNTIGNKEVKVRFSNGPYKNAFLNFVHKPKYEEMKAKQEKANELLSNNVAGSNDSYSRARQASIVENAPRPDLVNQKKLEEEEVRREKEKEEEYERELREEEMRDELREEIREEMMNKDSRKPSSEEMAAVAESQGFSL